MDQNQTSAYDNPNIPTTSLMEYAYLFWQWAWLVVLAGILAGGTAYFVNSRTTPVYQTSMRLFVSAPSASRSVDTSNMFITGYMTSTFSKMLTDYPVLEGVAAKLPDPKPDPASLAGKISIAEIPNTQLISVTVTGTDTEQIKLIANTLGEVFSEQMAVLQSKRYGASKETLDKQVADMGAQLAATQIELDRTKEKDPKDPNIPGIESRLTQYRTLYSSLVTSVEQVKIAEAQNSTSVYMVNPARETIQTGPRTFQNTVLATVLAMLLVAGGVFAVDFLDDTIKNPEEVRSRFGLPILGVISKHMPTGGKTITQEQPRSPVSEAFRTLRTNVKFSSVDNPLRRIVLTSPTPQDGKTTVSSNLAVVFAQSDKKVVLIDADLRRPQQHKRFVLPNRIGLSDAMVRPLDDLALITQATDQPGLKVITSGALPPNPAELLGSNKMLQVVDHLAEEFDLVIIDTPPVLSVTDAATLAASLDGVILVAKPGSTKLAAFQQTIDQLRAVGARILGVVLNDVAPGSRRYGYYYRRYYSKYSYYYSSADGEKQLKKSSTDAKAKV